jgi:hypothetical protein
LQPSKALGLCKKHYARDYYRRNPRTPEENRVNWLKSKFGITPGRYDMLLATQRGQCAICGSTEYDGTGRSFAVDHDHMTGEVRGLLCGRCNRAIGLFKEDPETLLRAAAYLKEDRLG